jgi:uncharacterized protein (DUF4415 family)
MNTTNKTEKELTYEVTQKDWEEGVAKGWTEDDMLKPGVYKVRRATRFSNKTEEVNVKLEADVVGFLKKNPQESYEKQINSALRKLMNEELKAASLNADFQPII